MTHTDSASLREDHLRRLDAAIAPLPHGVATEIRAGISEELTVLDGTALSARIDELGDPAGIAQEAARALAAEVTPVAPPSVAPPVTERRGFAIVAALTLSFGGFFAPFVGWVIGVVLVMLSSVWRKGEKALAIVLPPLLGAVSAGIAFLLWATSTSAVDSAEVVNPLVPTGLDAAWMIVAVLAMVLVPVSGLWLLWRMRGRTDS